MKVSSYEFIISLGFEWSFFTRRRVFSWPLVSLVRRRHSVNSIPTYADFGTVKGSYFACRYFMLLAVIMM